MRDLDAKEQQPVLGEAIKKPEVAQKQFTRIKEGILQGQDGKLQTNIAPPPAAPLWELFGIPRSSYFKDSE